MVCSVARFGTVIPLYVQIVLGSVKVAEGPTFVILLLPQFTRCSLCIV